MKWPPEVVTISSTAASLAEPPWKGKIRFVGEEVSVRVLSRRIEGGEITTVELSPARSPYRQSAALVP